MSEADQSLVNPIPVMNQVINRNFLMPRRAFELLVKPSDGSSLATRRHPSGDASRDSWIDHVFSTLPPLNVETQAELWPRINSDHVPVSVTLALGPARRQANHRTIAMVFLKPDLTHSQTQSIFNHPDWPLKPFI